MPEEVNANPGETVQVPTSVLADLVGEGKKFKTLEDLAKGKVNSDTFITKLSQENQELRTLVIELGTKVDASRQEFLNRVQDGTANGNTVITPNPAELNPSANQPQAQGLTPDDVVKLLENRDAQARARRNVDEVDAVLNRLLGADAKKFVSNKAAELGVSPEVLLETAQRSPGMFFRTVGINPGATPGNAALSSYQNGNTVPATGGDTGVRNKAYYDKLSTTMGAWKFATDKSTQIQMHQDMQRLGDSFFN